MQAHYPQSYLDVMTPMEEMVGSMYSGVAFTQDEKLIGLNLYGKEITDHHLRFFQEEEWKEDLRHLQSLNLTKTQITRFHLSADLPELVYVCLNEIPSLEQLKCDKGLAKLARLEITETGLTRLYIPDGYDRLYYLDLSQNEKLAKVILGEGGFAFLQVLFLRGTAITEFRLPKGFPELVHLYLNNNQLSQLDIESELPKLSCLQLKNNALKVVEETWLELAPHLHSCFLGNNDFPEELSFRIADTPDQDHLPILKEYFEQRKGGVEKNNECKVLLIGNGKAGKTAIVNRMVHDTFDPNWDSTHGITLLEKTMGDWQLNFWDFGGQDIYHATHRLFMQKNAVYILAWSHETEEPETRSGLYIKKADGSLVEKVYENQPLRYWFEYAKHLGEGSPMHVVQTKIGQPDNPIQEFPELKAEYDEAFQPGPFFHQVECAEDDPFENRFEELTGPLLSSVSSIKPKDQKIAKPLYEIRKYLRDLQKKGVRTLPLDTYLEKAKELGVLSPEKMLETWLFRSGVVYYQKGKFNNEIILDQAWAIKAIYTLFDRATGVPDQIRESQGIFNGAFVEEIWKKEGYEDRQTHELFISFMLSCDLCVEVEASESRVDFPDRTFMVPQLLENDRPETVDDFWGDKEGVWEYTFKQPFIPEGVIHGFIARTAYLATLREIWKIGIQIKEDKQFAWVEAGTNQIQVKVTQHGLPLFQKIRRLLQELTDGAGEETLTKDGKVYHPENVNFPGQLEGRDMFSPEEEREEVSRRMRREHPEKEAAFERDQKIRALQTERAELKAQNQNYERKLKIIGEPEEEVQKEAVLFITSNPLTTGKIRTEAEQKEAKAALFDGANKNMYRFSPLCKHPTFDQLIQRLEEKPLIVHFAGHGHWDGIVLHSAENEPLTLKIEVAVDQFKPLQNHTQLVILNACYAQDLAKAISELDMWVVGTNSALMDAGAISFTKGFYGPLGRGMPYTECFRAGRNMAIHEHTEKKERFQLWYQGQLLDV
ncbi:MAG: COR domain-containing protein [Bacteroidota bacterium]